MDSYFYVECPKNGMLITAFVHAERRNKSIRQNFVLPQTALQPLIINSDSRHWLPTQVRSSHNVLGYSCTVQVRHVPVIASSQSNAQHRSGGGLNRKSTARVPFFVLQNTAYADYNASWNELLDNPYVYYQHQRWIHIFIVCKTVRAAQIPRFFHRYGHFACTERAFIPPIHLYFNI